MKCHIGQRIGIQSKVTPAIAPQEQTSSIITTIVACTLRLSLLFLRQLRPFARRAMSSSSKPTNGSRIVSKEPLFPHEAKWTKLTKINWQDPSGKMRVWECAERSTRGTGGIDGIHYL